MEIELTRKLPPKIVRETMVEIDKVMVQLTQNSAERNSDWEVSHSDADAALCYVLSLIKPMLHPDLWLSIDHLIAAYDEVGKWYA